jgi:hypothetical protein
LLAAAIRLRVGLAGLARFRRIDAEEPDALAVDLECVAVDYGGAAGKFRRHCGPAWQDDKEEGNPTHCWQVSAVGRDQSGAMCGCYPFTAAPEAVLAAVQPLVHPIDGASTGFLLVTQAASFCGEMEARW